MAHVDLLRKALSTNSASTSFTQKIPTATEPTGTGVWDVFDRDHGLGLTPCSKSWLYLIPFGGNANDETFDMRIWGWSEVKGETLWIPTLLWDVSVILGNISGTAIAANMLMADTLTSNDGAAETTYRNLFDVQEDLGASALIHLMGVRKFEFDFDLTGTADAANCFWRLVDLD
jgi:hypothetical protein